MFEHSDPIFPIGANDLFNRAVLLKTQMRHRSNKIMFNPTETIAI